MRKFYEKSIYRIYRDCNQYIAYPKRHMIVLIFLMCLSSIIGVYSTDLIGHIMDEISQGNFNFRDTFFPIIVIFIISLLTAFSYQIITSINAINYQKKITDYTISLLCRIEYTWLEKQNSGDLINKKNEGVGNAISLVISAVPEFVFTVITIVVMFVYLFINNWQLTIVYFAFYPLAVYLQNHISIPIYDVDDKKFKATSEWHAIPIDAFRNYNSIKCYSMEETLLDYYRKRADVVQYYFKKSTWIKSLSCFIGEAIALLPIISLSIGIVVLANMNLISFGSIISFILIIFRLNAPLSGISHKMVNLRSVCANAKQVLDIWKAPCEKQMITDNSAERIDDNIDYAIVFRNVSFSYGEKDVLKDVSFTIKRGEHVALVGESGCGKSTIIRLLGRLYPEFSGQIEIMGQSILAQHPEELRKRLSLVSQNCDLFSVSLYENIIWAKEDATREDVYKACEDAGIMNFVNTLPQGIDMLAGEMGAQLSGGQKQRIAIARALVRDMDIMLFDEATSALDATVENEILEKIEKCIEGKTALIIAHKLSSIRHVDRILVLKDGIIVESGSFSELMEKQGVFHSLYQRQVCEGEKI